ncbi:MAG: hypothetical protein NZM29_07565, partial [Nitrospira sp.]|nr:hypothetical protein [Nitrospira sp.]
MNNSLLQDDLARVLSECEAEEVQFIGSVQSFGTLFVVDEHFKIEHCGGVVDAWTPWQAGEVVGRSLADVLPVDIMAATQRALLEAERMPGHHQWIGSWSFAAQETSLSALAHVYSGRRFVEVLVGGDS